MSRWDPAILLASPFPLAKGGVRATAAHHRELAELWRTELSPGQLGASGAYHDALATSLELATDGCINIPVITAQPNIMAITRSWPDPNGPNAFRALSSPRPTWSSWSSSTSSIENEDPAALHNYSPRFGGCGAEYSCGALTQGNGVDHG